VRLLRQYLPGVTALRDVGLTGFALVEEHLPDTIRRRCRHVVTEDARVGEAAEALRAAVIYTVDGAKPPTTVGGL
jgi:galactokinase